MFFGISRILPKIACRSNSAFSTNFVGKTKFLKPIRLQIKQLTSSATNGSVKQPKVVGYWLLTTAGLVSGAVTLGGLTRLTESGLSMVEWNLIRDMRPPRSEEEWQREFEKYQQFPEYKHKSDIEKMTLEQFKKIYYFEFSHRMWGRFVGLFFLIPAAAFWARGYLNRRLKIRVLVFGSMLIGQGALGWYMVKSGLEEKNDVPRVSPGRLASHLGLALLLYAGTLWNGLSLVFPQHVIPDSPRYLFVRRRLAHPLMLLIFTTAISGAFVAGLDAGLTYNSWPKMADRWIPSDLTALEPFSRNFYENPTMVQFNHRHLGEFTFFAILGYYMYARKIHGLHPRGRMALNCLMGMACVQVGLGISTLLTYVPTWLASCHQSGSVALLSCAVWFANEIRRFKGIR